MSSSPDPIKLDKDSVDRAIQKISELDYSIATTEEIKNILKALLTGYRISAPKYGPGVYIYRIRKCAKPINIKEITYPPADLAGIGRANEKGSSIFYASIGKSVPFFELDAVLGDEFALSVWKTKKDMLLNHVGFSEEAGKALNSLRNLGQVYDFIKNMNTFGDTNVTVYNFLAGCFVQQIGPTETDKYKLTNAITNHFLAGDIFDGIMYPTVRMFGNADNIALRTSFVDHGLSLVSIEYLKITSKDGTRFTTETLDTSTEWDEDGVISWSGRILGFNFKGPSETKLQFDGSEWVTKDIDGSRMDPVPTELIDRNPTELLSKYKNSYPETIKSSSPLEIQTPDGKLMTRNTMYFESSKQEKFMSFYIPVCSEPLQVAIALAKAYQQIVDIVRDQTPEIISKKANEIAIIGENNVVSTKYYRDKRLIHFYSENRIDSKVLGENVEPGFELLVECPSIPPPTIKYFYKENSKK